MSAFKSLLVGLLLAGAATPSPHVSFPVVFEDNLGQAPPKAQYLARGLGWQALFCEGWVDFNYRDASLRLEFEGGTITEPQSQGPLRSSGSYFAGPDPKKWLRSVPHHTRVAYRQIYPGIDVIFHGAESQLEYDFHIAPDASPGAILLRYRGADRIRIGERGELLIDAGTSQIEQAPPKAFQIIDGARRPVKAAYRLFPDQIVGFDLGDYDPRQELVIDPLLYGTFFGGTQVIAEPQIAVDSEGMIYLAGISQGVDFPVTPGERSSGGLFLAKIDPTKSGVESLIHSSFLAGHAAQLRLRVDDQDRLVLAGSTSSRDYPTTPNAHQPAHSIPIETGPGAYDVFVSLLDFQADRPQLIYSTFYGGNREELLGSVHLDGSGKIYLRGETDSMDFVRTADAFQNSCDGIFPGSSRGCNWVAIIDPARPGKDSLVYSTFVHIFTQHLQVDPRGRFQFAMQVGPGEYPLLETTPDAFQPLPVLSELYQGDVYYWVLDPAKPGAEGLAYASYLGGGGRELLNSLLLDPQGRAWMAGRTNSGDFPITSETPSEPCNASRPRCSPISTEDVFVSRFDPDLDGEESLTFSVRFGGPSSDTQTFLALDDAGMIYLTGESDAEDFPVTENALDVPCILDRNGICITSGRFLAKFDPDAPPGESLVLATLIGGSDAARSDLLTDLLVSPGGDAILVGITGALDYPLTPGALDSVRNPFSIFGVYRPFVTRIRTEPADQVKIAYSTLLGSSVESTRNTLLARDGSFYYSGVNYLPQAPTSPNAFDRVCGFGSVTENGICVPNIYVARLDLRDVETLVSAQAELRFTYEIPSETPPAQALEIISSDPSLEIKLAAISDFDWLRVEPTSLAGGGAVSVRVDPSKLQAGQYLGIIEFGSAWPVLRRLVRVALTVEAPPPSAIGGVLHAASFENRPIAPGQIISIFGQNFGPAEGRGAKLDRSGSISVDIAEVFVQVNRSLAPLVFVRHDQINAIVPYGLDEGPTVNLQVITNRGSSPVLQVPFAEAAPGIFTANGAGSGPGAILNQDGALNTAANPAARGSVIVLYATGEGQTEPPGVSGALAAAPYPTPVLPVEVRIGGQTAQILFAGAAPGFAGLLQVNATVPAEAPQGEAVPIELLIGNQSSQPGVSVAIE